MPPRPGGPLRIRRLIAAPSPASRLAGPPPGKVFVTVGHVPARAHGEPLAVEERTRRVGGCENLGKRSGAESVELLVPIQPIPSRSVPIWFRRQKAGGWNGLILWDFMVGARGFEPPTPCPPDKCANRAALRSDASAYRGAAAAMQRARCAVLQIFGGQADRHAPSLPPAIRFGRSRNAALRLQQGIEHSDGCPYICGKAGD